MEGLRFGSAGNRPKGLRGRFVLLIVLPPAFLGASLLLLQEYAFQNWNPGNPAVVTILRVGGFTLCVLALILAAAFGYLLLDRISRPLRLLLRMAEGGEAPAGPDAGGGHPGAEIYELQRMVSVLVNQNKAGARAMEELEQVRQHVTKLREDVARTGQHGVLAPVRPLPEGPLREIGLSLEAKRMQLRSFFLDLHQRVHALDSEISALGALEGLLDEEGEPGESRVGGERGVGGELGASGEQGAAGEWGVYGERSGDGERGENGERGANGKQRGTVANARSQADEQAGMPAHAANATVRGALEELRDVGSVLTLEAVRIAGTPAPLADQRLRRFQDSLEALEVGIFSKEREEEEEKEEQGGGGEESRLRYSRLQEHMKTLHRLLGEVEQR